LIVSDISIIGPEVAQLIGVRCIAITNFLWTTQYEGLKLHKSIIEEFNESYSKIHNVINYELSLLSNPEDGGGFKAGFISRKFDESRIKKIKNELGKILLITVGKSANIRNIDVKNFDGTVITTEGVDVTYSGEVIKLPLMTLDTHNYIAASDVIITKAGWGTIAESILSRKPMVLIERDDVIEDTHNISQLKKNKLAISIPENEMRFIDYRELERKIELNIDIDRYSEYKNNIGCIAEYIRRIVKDQK
jgi:UDP-N-acetylglucosamine transferase subunit ALG13